MIRINGITYRDKLLGVRTLQRLSNTFYQNFRKIVFVLN